VQDEGRYVEVNGQEADDEAIALLDHEGWGHFTAMQVRDGRPSFLGGAGGAEREHHRDAGAPRREAVLAALALE